MTLVVLIALVGFCAQEPARFEVASIRPSPPRAPENDLVDRGKGGPGTDSPTLFQCERCDLMSLIEKAFDLKRFQEQYLDVLPHDEFQIRARLQAGATQSQFRTMLQNLLAERFHLSSHFETKQILGLELRLSKNGSKLTPAAPHADADSNDGPVKLDRDGYPILIRTGRYGAAGRVTERFDAINMRELADRLASEFNRLVTDATGLTGTYDIVIKYWVGEAQTAAISNSAETPLLSEGPTIREALESQLGLQLVSRKVSARVFVVDHVDKSPTPN